MTLQVFKLSNAYLGSVAKEKQILSGTLHILQTPAVLQGTTEMPLPPLYVSSPSL